MTGQIKLFEEITIFDAHDRFNSAPAHDSITCVVVPGCESLSDEEVRRLMPDDFLPIFSSWPKRNWGNSGVGDIYSYLKSKQIGLFQPIEFVKENEHWVLHGRVHYNGGRHVNNDLLTSPRLVALSVDIERGDPTKGRRVFQLARLLVSPK
jgi:hypothetical protein